MCDCKKPKISGLMNTNLLVKRVMHTGIGVAGAVAAQYAGSIIPATVDSLYTDAGKVVVGGLVLPMLAKGAFGEYLAAFGNGFAIQGGLNLANQYLVKPTGYVRMGGVDNSDYALMGLDNAGYALYGGAARSQPMAPGTISTYSM